MSTCTQQVTTHFTKYSTSIKVGPIWLPLLFAHLIQILFNLRKWKVDLSHDSLLIFWLFKTHSLQAGGFYKLTFCLSLTHYEPCYWSDYLESCTLIGWKHDFLPRILRKKTKNAQILVEMWQTFLPGTGHSIFHSPDPSQRFISVQNAWTQYDREKIASFSLPSAFHIDMYQNCILEC